MMSRLAANGDRGKEIQNVWSAVVRACWRSVSSTRSASRISSMVPVIDTSDSESSEGGLVAEAGRSAWASTLRVDFVGQRPQSPDANDLAGITFRQLQQVIEGTLGPGKIVPGRGAIEARAGAKGGILASDLRRENTGSSNRSRFSIISMV